MFYKSVSLLDHTQHLRLCKWGSACLMKDVLDKRWAKLSVADLKIQKTVGIKMGSLLYDTEFVSFLVWKEITSLKHPEKYLVLKNVSFS